MDTTETEKTEVEIAQENFSDGKLQRIFELQKAGTLCDVDLICRGGSISAHRLVLLSSDSKYLKLHVLKEVKDDHKVPLNNFSVESVTELVNYLYTGVFKLYLSLVDEMMELFCFLGLTICSESLTQFVESDNKYKQELERQKNIRSKKWMSVAQLELIKVDGQPKFQLVLKPKSVAKETQNKTNSITKSNVLQSPMQTSVTMVTTDSFSTAVQNPPQKMVSIVTKDSLSNTTQVQDLLHKSKTTTTCSPTLSTAVQKQTTLVPPRTQTRTQQNIETASPQMKTRAQQSLETASTRLQTRTQEKKGKASVVLTAEQQVKSLPGRILTRGQKKQEQVSPDVQITDKQNKGLVSPGLQIREKLSKEKVSPTKIVEKETKTNQIKETVINAAGTETWEHDKDSHCVHENDELVAPDSQTSAEPNSCGKHDVPVQTGTKLRKTIPTVISRTASKAKSAEATKTAIKPKSTITSTSAENKIISDPLSNVEVHTSSISVHSGEGERGNTSTEGLNDFDGGALSSIDHNSTDVKMKLKLKLKSNDSGGAAPFSKDPNSKEELNDSGRDDSNTLDPDSNEGLNNLGREDSNTIDPEDHEHESDNDDEWKDCRWKVILADGKGEVILTGNGSKGEVTEPKQVFSTHEKNVKKENDEILQENSSCSINNKPKQVLLTREKNVKIENDEILQENSSCSVKDQIVSEIGPDTSTEIKAKYEPLLVTEDPEISSLTSSLNTIDGVQEDVQKKDDSNRLKDTNKSQTLLPYECGMCSVKFALLDDLITHVRVHSKSIDKTFQCDVEGCGKKYTKRNSFNKHKRVHACTGSIADGGTPFNQSLDQPQNDVDAKNNETSQPKKRKKRSDERKFHCETCGSRFKRKDHLKKHMMTHTGEKPWKCEICEKAFTCKITLQEHVMLHTGDKPYKCDVCDQAYVKERYLRLHMRSHTGEKPYMCDVCGKTFSRNNALQQHTKIHQNVDKTHACEICGKRFHQKHALDSHKQWIHSQERPHQCNLCGKTYKLSSYLKFHMKHVHSDIKPFTCEVCGLSFKNQRVYRNHMFTHNGEHPFKCEHCGRVYPEEYMLRRHERVHLNIRPHICDICGKGFTGHNYLKSHMAIHQPDRQKYSCDVCGKTLSSIPSLKFHQNTHNEPQFTCHVCNKAFRFKNNLERHIKTHTGQKSFNCEQCDKEFTRASNLKKHIAKLHSQEGYNNVQHVEVIVDNFLISDL